MTEFKKLLFIVNKHAGGRYHRRLESTILRYCKKHKAQAIIQFTERPGHATELAQAAKHHYSAIIAVGGDGTVNEIAQALVSTSIPLGIIPKGSGNGLARHLKIPLRTGPALKHIFANHQLAIDTFRINDKLSVNVSGIGFDAHIANLFAKYKTRGFRGYARLVLNEYRKYSEFEWSLGQENPMQSHKSFIIAIANSSQYGNNAFIAPAASVTDGELNLSMVKKIPLYKSVRFAYRLFTRKLKERHFYLAKGAANFSIRMPTPQALHIDGEAAGYADSVDVSILPASLRVLVPASVKLKS